MVRRVVCMQRPKVTSYLEMLSPSDLRGSTRTSFPVTLSELDRQSPEVRRITLRVGRPYNWPSQSWTDDEWHHYLTRPYLRHWLGTAGDDAIGIASMDVCPDGTVEIDTFGVAPDHVGRGLGSVFLAVATRTAWNAASDVKRVWLHTSSHDHPHALDNYLARGFCIYKTVTESW